MYVKLLSLFAAVVLVAACESTPKDSGAASGSGRAGLSTGANGTGTGAIRPGSQEDLASLGGQGTGDRVFFQYDRSDLTPEARASSSR